MSFIPHELIVDILSRLPVKSLLRFRCVSKPWCQLIKSPSFVQMHLKRSTQSDSFILMLIADGTVYSVNHDVVLSDEVLEIDYPFRSETCYVWVIGSCNGLLCISVNAPYDDGDHVTCLWNPTTREYKEIPITPIRIIEDHELYREMYGFGHAIPHDDYKIVRILQFYKLRQVDGEVELESFCSEVSVYTLGSDTWKQIKEIPYNLSDTTFFGVHANGALHWVSNLRYELQSSDDKVIVALDLGDEEYKEVPQPCYSSKNFDMNLGVLEGCLCILCNMNNNQLDVWKMKDYGVRESWAKLFIIKQSTFFQNLSGLKFIKIVKNGEILLNNDKEMSLAYYDPNHGTVRDLHIHGYAETYLESLVSLNSRDYVEAA